MSLSGYVELRRAAFITSTREAVREAIANREVPRTATAEITDAAADAAAANGQSLESRPHQRVGGDRSAGRPSPLLIRSDTVQVEPLLDFPAGTDAAPSSATALAPGCWSSCCYCCTATFRQPTSPPA
jgi:hypothetical protein